MRLVLHPKVYSDIALNPLIKLLQRQTGGWIRFELGIAPKRLACAGVVVQEMRSRVAVIARQAGISTSGVSNIRKDEL